MLKTIAVCILALAVLKKGGSLLMKLLLACLLIAAFVFVGKILFMLAAGVILVMVARRVLL